MKKQPKAVYIIENGGYTELTYEEFRRREQICPLYADKLFLPLYGRLMEVSKEDYTEFYRAKRRQKYLDERSADNGDFSYDMLTTDEFSGEDILIAEQPDVCDTVVESIMTDKLHKSLQLLNQDEKLLIHALYFERKSERKVSAETGIPVREALERVRKTPPMKGLSPEERRKNLKNAFQADDFVVKSKKVLMCDDIYTTGATMDAATGALLGAGAVKVCGIFICTGE